jgi:hypothetical protein
LLEATSQERSRRTLLEPETLRTLILLLYGTGLQAGEALRLRPPAAAGYLPWAHQCLWNPSLPEHDARAFGGGLTSLRAICSPGEGGS